jgi:rhodanese-related sulfurtransferase
MIISKMKLAVYRGAHRLSTPRLLFSSRSSVSRCSAIHSINQEFISIFAAISASILLFTEPSLAEIWIREQPFTASMSSSKEFQLDKDQERVISPQDAFDLMGNGANYLDVRTESEFMNGHPPGASNIPYLLESGAFNPHFNAEFKVRFPNKMRPIIVGCKSGSRSTPATVLIMHSGYSDVRNQKGGFDAWLKAGLPTVVEILTQD